MARIKATIVLGVQTKRKRWPNPINEEQKNIIRQLCDPKKNPYKYILKDPKTNKLDFDIELINPENLLQNQRSYMLYSTCEENMLREITNKRHQMQARRAHKKTMALARYGLSGKSSVQDRTNRRTNTETSVKTSKSKRQRKKSFGETVGNLGKRGSIDSSDSGSFDSSEDAFTDQISPSGRVYKVKKSKKSKSKKKKIKKKKKGPRGLEDLDEDSNDEGGSSDLSEEFRFKPWGKGPEVHKGGERKHMARHSMHLPQGSSQKVTRKWAQRAA